ncbi:MAG TPA: alpha-L-fucosidase [Candidatus Eisenbergiella merdavium]|uniref:alpha-L-fucosidase n=1 Tax=Candidatus Eisenbergiella merdavium TaxID=2838551 RepID=A0A9D2NHW5_9FIRM|nr:alpha-L-fucosidase [Candidatus Eisenbergiella merdavium]
MEHDMIRQIPALVPNAGQRAQIERKFGMFIHFGINTFGNVEWSHGDILAERYRPAEIAADEWVRTAFEAGMNYVVLVTKHHDGFCLWDTAYTDYCVRESGNPTDVVKEVSKACEKYGVKLGLYYSLWDRNCRDYKNNFQDGYIPYMKKQLTELLDGRYGEVVELWLDGSWDKARQEWHFEEIYDLVKRLQPACQIGINHTVGDDFGIACGPEEPRYLPKNYQNNDPLRMFPSDFRLWDPHMCRADDPKIYTYQGNSYYLPFEMTVCSRTGFSWFYSNAYEEKAFLDVEETVQNIKTLFAAENMAVINMPPDTTGHLVQGDVDHLMEISEKLGLRRVGQKI